MDNRVFLLLSNMQAHVALSSFTVLDLIFGWACGAAADIRVSYVGINAIYLGPFLMQNKSSPSEYAPGHGGAPGGNISVHGSNQSIPCTHLRKCFMTIFPLIAFSASAT